MIQIKIWFQNRRSKVKKMMKQRSAPGYEEDPAYRLGHGATIPPPSGIPYPGFPDYISQGGTLSPSVTGGHPCPTSTYASHAELRNNIAEQYAADFVALASVNHQSAAAAATAPIHHWEQYRHNLQQSLNK